MQIHNIILDNYRKFDAFLAMIPSESLSYKALLSIRLSYAAIHGKKQKQSAIDTIKQILKLFISLKSIFMTRASLSQKSNILLIGSHPLDTQVAELLAIPNAQVIFLKKIFSITRQDIYLLYTLALCCFYVIRYKTLHLPIFLKSSQGLIDFLITYRDLDLSQINALVMESDSLPKDVALILRAKEMHLPTIKIDHFLIDPINHNRIFCDYYFYPSILHREIMESFTVNASIHYIKGGIIHWDSLSRYSKKKKNESKEITFFGQHGDTLGQKDEIFYIEEILSLMDETDHLNIKTHPHDKSNKFDLYIGNPLIALLKSTEDNYSLIAKSDVCFSIGSTMTMEAKHICKNSYFINYDAEAFEGYINYNTFNNAIETISNRETLKKSLHEDSTFEISNFIERFNLSYPDSTTKLRILISKIQNEKKHL